MIAILVIHNPAEGADPDKLDKAWTDLIAEMEKARLLGVVRLNESAFRIDLSTASHVMAGLMNAAAAARTMAAVNSRSRCGLASVLFGVGPLRAPEGASTANGTRGACGGGEEHRINPPLLMAAKVRGWNRCPRRSAAVIFGNCPAPGTAANPFQNRCAPGRHVTHLSCEDSFGNFGNGAAEGSDAHRLYEM